jgi:hypothetical protein
MREQARVKCYLFCKPLALGALRIYYDQLRAWWPGRTEAVILAVEIEWNISKTRHF